MKIATWNIDRLKRRSLMDKIVNKCNSFTPDILVLTESDEQIKPDMKYSIHTPKLIDAPNNYYLPAKYRPTENRVSIFSNYPIIKEYFTYDKYTSLCVELETSYGNLIVYGTIMGITGKNDSFFKKDVLYQMNDIKGLSTHGNVCICGDFNCSFADNYYFNKFARNTLLESFHSCGISLVTRNILECVDHIAISNNFLSTREYSIEEWNYDKKLSDHKGIMVSI